MTDKNTIPEADFSFVRYANCWEDAELLMKGLRPTSGKRILSIGSAGDNSLSMLQDGAEVVAADLNPAQLACVELRKEAVRALNRQAFLRFAGIAEADDRLQTYQLIRPQLSSAVQRYWDAGSHAIEHGFIHAGKFENYFQLFRKKIIPLIHRRKTVDEMMRPKNTNARKEFYDTVWNNRRWRLLFRLFFSKRIMGRHGRDPEFFKHVEGAVADRILERTHHALTALDTSTNPYLCYILSGNFEAALPHYLMPGNYEAIQRNIDHLSIRQGAIDAIAEEYGENSFDGFNLSDIFEYLSRDQCEEVYGRLLASARPTARLAYWNMLVPRECPATWSNRVVPVKDEADPLFAQDRAFFYSRFVLEEVR